MRIENHGISRSDHVDDIPRDGGDRVRDGCDAADDAPRSGIVHRDTGVTAHAVRRKILGAEDIFDTVKLGNLVVEAADLGLLKLDLTPTFSIGRAHRLDDLDDFGAARPPFFGELLEAATCGLGGRCRIGKDAVAPSA